MPLPREFYEIFMRPGNSIVWSNDQGNKQIVRAEEDGRGFTVETSMEVPIFDDGSGESVFTVLRQSVIGGLFATNFQGVSVLFRHKR